ncbi:MAG: ATP-dependent helicase [Candidatus Omnitrophica bacterium]|nr:ATP-dependent helicase [Candidatus Omnitrophota bacterium]
MIAGAGTGKTRVIAHRIAFLLESKPDVRPENVLALSFSRKSAEELKRRAEQLLESRDGDLEILTFHGFCHRFLQEEGGESGGPARFQLLDRPESWIFFRRLLPRLKLSHYWNIAYPADCIDGFLRFISRAKDELVTPEEFSDYARRLTDPQERARAAEVARVYRTYQEELKAAGCFDFGDLLLETYRTLREKPALLERMRRRYRYIVVDEFQDTNVAQIRLLGLLAGSDGNLCVVGDDDQAIYRFRGASFASFLLMKEMFPQVRTIRLFRNYRSTQNILEVSNRFIRRNEPDRYDPAKNLWTEGLEGSPVRILVCHDDLHEAETVAQKIREIYEGQPLAERSFSRVAVFYRAHAHREYAAESLRRNGIPFITQGGSSLFDHPEIKDVVSFLKVIHDPSDTIELFRVLNLPVWGISVDDLLALNASARERQVALFDLLKRPDGLSAVSKEGKHALGEFVREWDAFRTRAFRTGIDQLVQAVLEEGSLRMLFCLPVQEGQDSLVCLGRFLRFVHRYAHNHPQKRTLEEFLWYADAYQEAGGDLPQEDEEDAGLRLDAVRMMSIHQAKGLEFDWVILLSNVQGRFPTRTRPEPIPFPDELMKERLPQGDYHLQEERRLCYVACTRARKELFLMTRDRPYQRPSVFIQEIKEEGLGKQVAVEDLRSAVSALEDGMQNPFLQGATIPVASLHEERRILQIIRSIRSLNRDDQSGFERLMEELKTAASLLLGKQSQMHTRFIHAAVAPQTKFSYTQLETFRYCPLKYKFAYLYQIPVKPTPQMSFGVDLHACLEAFFRRVVTGETPSLADLLDTFHRCHVPGRYGEAGQDEEYRRRGDEMLSAFYRKHEGNFGMPLLLEKPFLLPFGDFFLKGVIDRVDPLPEGGVEIVDYKTGKPKDDASEDEQLQLRLYALAVKKNFNMDPKKIGFYFLQVNEKLSFEIDPASLEKTYQKIEDLIEEIRQSDFSPTPSFFKCRRCDFRRLCPASEA